jgi:hypothetical protein
MLAPFAVAGALKGNSLGSCVDRGEPVGAERMILGAPLREPCMSCVSFAACPARSGDLERGLRAMAAGRARERQCVWESRVNCDVILPWSIGVTRHREVDGTAGIQVAELLRRCLV